jgi:hypothetical protein
MGPSSLRPSHVTASTSPRTLPCDGLQTPDEEPAERASTSRTCATILSVVVASWLPVCVLYLYLNPWARLRRRVAPWCCLPRSDRHSNAADQRRRHSRCSSYSSCRCRWSSRGCFVVAVRERPSQLGGRSVGRFEYHPAKPVTPVRAVMKGGGGGVRWWQDGDTRKASVCGLMRTRRNCC